MKKQLSLSKILIGTAAGLTLCGCSLFSGPEQSSITYYDLCQPEKIAVVPLNVDQFVNFAGERQKMLRRQDSFLLQSSDFHKWIQSPGGMLTRYLRLAFRDEPGDPLNRKADPLQLRGEVLTFEVCDRQAVLGVRYQLRRGERSFGKTVMFREKIKSRGPSGFAQAMSQAAERLARQIAADAAAFPAERK